MQTLFTLWIALAFIVVGAGCEESTDDAANAVSAAKALMEATSEIKQAGEAADEAAKAAEAKARSEVPEGASEEEAEQLVEQAKAIAALQAVQKAGGTGPITNWRQLQPFLPETLGDFVADGKLKGATTNAGSFKVTNVERRYKAGERRADVSISDAFLAPAMKAPFKMAAMINEDSTEGYKKGTRIAGNTAIVEWREDRKRSKALILVSDRFMVHVKVSHAASDDDAVKLASLIDLDELATVVGEEEAKKAE